MEGKIFPDSSNIYQDQARILFNYYKMAADKIVTEEERIEEQIEELRSQRAEYEARRSKTWYWYFTIILFFMAFVKKNEYDRKIAEIDGEIGSLEQAHREIFRDYRIEKLGVAYVPVADQVKYEDKSFMVDFTGEVPDSEVSLKLPKQNQLLVDTIGRIDSLATEAPLVESSDDVEVLETADYSTSIV